MKDRKYTFRELEVLAKFHLDPDRLTQEYTGQTTIDGENYKLPEKKDVSRCSHCGGIGMDTNGARCSHCEGRGMLLTESEVVDGEQKKG